MVRSPAFLLALLLIAGCGRGPAKKPVQQAQAPPRPAAVSPKPMAPKPAKATAKAAPAVAERSVADWIGDLKSDDTDQRSRAAAALGKLGPAAKDAVAPLHEMLKDKQPGLRRAAAEALGKIGPDAKAAVPTLVGLSQDRNANVREQSLLALSRIDPQGPGVIDTFGKALRDKDAAVYTTAASVLAKLGKPAVPTLLDALKDQDAKVYLAAATALGEIGADAKDAVPPLSAALKSLDDTLLTIPFQPNLKEPVPQKSPNAPTAALIVRDFDGIAVHTLLNLQRLFPNHFKNVVFISVGVIDTGQFKGHSEVESLKRKTEETLKSFVEYANCLGWYAEYRYELGVDLIAELEALCDSVAKEFPRTVFFSGRLVFERENFFTRLLHNHTPFTLQQRLQFAGRDMMILPIRVFANA